MDRVRSQGDESALWSAPDPTAMFVWRRWLRSFLLLLIGFGGVTYVGTVLIDPFSTGRFTPFQRVDLASSNMRLAKAGLARDAHFDAAIFGSSTSIGLDPLKIAVSTDRSIVHLGIAAAVPADQATVAQSFNSHHRGMRVINIFVLDQLWCRPSAPDAERWGSFPTWLYVGSDREYLSRIFNWDSLVTAARRVGIWLGLVGEAARLDGYDPIKGYKTDEPANLAYMRAQPRPTVGPSADAPFPAIDAFESLIEGLDSSAGEVLVFAPAHVSTLPVEGSPAAARLDACKAAFQHIAKRRPNAGYLDLLVDNQMTQDAGNFYDGPHYRDNVARWMEPQIARVVRDIAGK